MRLGLSASAALFAAALLYPATGALAHDGTHHEASDGRGNESSRDGDWRAARDPRPYFEPSAREAWMADCRDRILSTDARWRGSREDREDRADDECEAYLDDYYARYYQGAYGTPRGYGSYPGYPSYVPAQGYAPGCCSVAPVMMVPAPRAEPECTETVEYVYEDVPVRPKIRRSKPVPDKRVRIAPDKRVLTSRATAARHCCCAVQSVKK